MDNGIKTPNLALTPISDGVVVNRSGNTLVQPIGDLATQLAATGEIADKIQGAQLGRKDARTWDELKVTVGERLQGGTVAKTDSGTHVDPVTGQTVQNSGTFSCAVPPTGWTRTGDFFDQAGLEQGIADLQATKADTSALAEEADARNSDVADLDARKADAPAPISVFQYAGHNLARVRTYDDYTLEGGLTQEGIPFDVHRHDLSQDAVYSKVVTFGDSNILAIVLRRDGKRPYIRGLEQPTDFPDVLHFAIYGQSNAGGADALPVVSGAFQNLGNIKFAMGMQTWNFIYGPTFQGALGRGDGMFDFVPLYEQDHGNGQGEFFSTGMTAQFKLSGVGGRYHTGNLENAKPHILTSSSSTGGIYLSALMPDDPEQKGYYKLFEDDMRRAKAKAEALGMTYGFGGVIFAQGEAESSALKLTPTGAVQPFTTVQNAWRDNLIALRAAQEASRKALVGGVAPMPMWAICGRYPLIGNALQDAASRDAHIHLTAPNYFAPNAINSQLDPALDPSHRKYGDVLHMTADGNRWVGEYIGKLQHRILKLGRREKVLLIKDVWRVGNNEIRVQFDVPYKPLRLDTEFVFPVANAGLRVFAGTLDAVGAQASITSVSIISDDTIAIITGTTIAAGGNFLVEYMGEKFGYNSTAVLESVQDGVAYANGNATKELVFNGDVRDQFLPGLRNGAMYVIQGGGSFNPCIRDLRFSGGKTILRGDAATFGTPIIGSVVGISAPFAVGNIVDSDMAMSVYQFSDPAYGQHQGKYYPLHNYAFPFIKAVRT
jgi:hypothetical protein